MLTDSLHTFWSDPGRWRTRLNELPSEPAAIPDALENFVIHHAIARHMGISVPEAAEPDRNLRTLSRLIETLVKRAARPLIERREISNYLYGTCHDFALLAAGTLREHGVPARLRVGHAGYFIPGKWEDHWVCEYRTEDRWALLDGQLGPMAREGFKIGFPVADIPRAGWRSAASIWRAIQAGTVDENTCGVSFVPWDYWGLARRFLETRDVTKNEARQIDALAEALDPAPATRDDASAILDRFPWARPTETVSSIIVAAPVEVPIQPAASP